jgi:hypothetical protein
VLIAPITVSPTKPLTPTHVKFLLLIDALYRATAELADVTCVYDHRAFATGGQTTGFWAYLDRVLPGADFAGAGEEDIGELYVRYHKENPAPAVRAGGGLHASAVRILEIWREHYRTLNLFDIDLGLHGPPRLPDGELIELLVQRHLCVDGRPVRAPVYLDLTAQGIPLRGLVNPDGQPNYLMCVLGQLVPLAGRYDLTVLMYDRELREDYVLVERVLRAFGATAARFEVDRVPLDGVVASSRRGGWRGYTLDALRSQVDGGTADFRLALRLYLIAVLGKGTAGSFRVPDLRRWVGRARALRTAPADQVPLEPFLHKLSRPTGYVDPYRLTAGLLAKSPRVPVRALLDRVYP